MVAHSKEVVHVVEAHFIETCSAVGEVTEGAGWTEVAVSQRGRGFCHALHGAWGTTDACRAVTAPAGGVRSVRWIWRPVSSPLLVL